jgi:hypothetical protein
MAAEADIMIADMDFHIDPWGKKMETRIKNALRRNGIMTLRQLLDTDGPIEGLSIVSYMIIDTKLQDMGLARKDVGHVVTIRTSERR